MRTDLGKVQDVNSEIQVLANHLGVLYWDPVSALCQDGATCVAVVKAQRQDIDISGVALIAWDYGHLTLSGAYEVGERLLNFIDSETARVEN